jgi:hypothetical protein
MEILIIGVLLVAVMVYVSTKIKKAAAREFEPETVEKEDFRLEKPGGFLYPLNKENDFAYEAYSKTYGDKGTRNIWRARTRLRVSDGLNIRKLINEIKKDEIDFSEKVLDDLPEGQIGSIVRTSKEDDDVDYRVLRKIVGNKSTNKTYELKTTILCPYEDEYTDDICEMMRSFELTG